MHLERAAFIIFVIYDIVAFVGHIKRDTDCRGVFLLAAYGHVTAVGKIKHRYHGILVIHSYLYFSLAVVEDIGLQLIEDLAVESSADKHALILYAGELLMQELQGGVATLKTPIRIGDIVTYKSVPVISAH